MTDTPKYDELCARIEELKARRGGRPMHPVEAGLRRAHSKAITSGQRAGERAVGNVFRPFEYEPVGSYDHREVAQRAQEAARVASARARERYAAKTLEGIA